MTARFLQVDHNRIVVPFRTVMSDWAVLMPELEGGECPEASAILVFDEPASPTVVAARITTEVRVGEELSVASESFQTRVALAERPRERQQDGDRQAVGLLGSFQPEGITAGNAVQVVRAGSETHRILWLPSGPDFADGGPCETCTQRAQDWERAGIPAAEVRKWIDSGLRSAKDARPWYRLGLSPTDAATWAEVGSSATDASYWIGGGVTNGHLAEQWIRIGVNWQDAESLSKAGMSPDQVETSAQQIGLPVRDAVRLLVGTRGDVSRAQRACSLLSRFPESSSNSDELANVLQAGFTVEGTLKLLDQGVPAYEFWSFAQLGLTETDVAHVVSHGDIPVHEMTLAFKCGYSAEEIVRLADGVRVFREITNRPNFSLYGAASSGIGPDEMTETKAHQFLIEERQLRRSYGLKGNEGFGDYGPDGYLGAGIVVGFSEWFDLGISPAAAKKFTAADVNPADAIALLQKGYTPREIVQAAESTGLADLREREVTPLPWTTYFARSRAADYDFTVTSNADRGRFFGALKALAVPHRTNVQMFSDRVEEWVFLDGGVTGVGRYGFSGSGGVWVSGASALKFLCGRLGLGAPGRLSGDAGQLTHDQLEDAVQRQRHSWPTMAQCLRDVYGADK